MKLLETDPAGRWPRPNTRLLVVPAALLLLCAAAPLEARWTIDLEAGLASSGYNDVRIPGDSGTDISFTDDLETDREFFYRARLVYRTGRHALGLLAAPLRLDASGVIDRTIRFNGEEFPEGSECAARYRFDSYRLSYRYDFHRSERLEIGAGVTAKIRDASVKLEDDLRSSEKKNTGFVPLLNFRILWNVAGKAWLVFEADALAAPQGRAEDVIAALRYAAGDGYAFKLGYRILEGGADNDEVYNFALVHYLVLGAEVSF